MGPKETYIVAEALSRALKDALATNDPSNLRGAVAESYRQVYEATGGEARSFNLSLDGEEVATFSFPKTEGTDDWEEEVSGVEDYPKMRDWMEAQPAEDFRAFAMDHMDEYAAWCLSNGVACEGAGTRTVRHKGRPEAVNLNGSFRFKPGGRERALKRLLEDSPALAPAVRGYL